MKSLPILFIGLFATLGLSWLGLGLLNQQTIGALDPAPESALLGGEEEGEEPSLLGQNRLPPRPLSRAHEGAQVYADLGCYQCHTQKVRPAELGFDVARDWGPRQKVARDMVRRYKPMTGTIRIGPDLSNIGNRAESDNWLHLHLFNPRLNQPAANKPAFRFLYKSRPKSGDPLDKRQKTALQFPSRIPKRLAKTLRTHEIVPTERASRLVAYLKSLKMDYELPEATFPQEEEE